MGLGCSGGRSSAVRGFGARARARCGGCGLRVRISGLLLSCPVLLPRLLSLSVLCPDAGRGPAAASELRRAPGRAGGGLLVLLRRSKGLLSLCEGMPRRLAESCSAAAALNEIHLLPAARRAHRMRKRAYGPERHGAAGQQQ